MEDDNGRLQNKLSALGTTLRARFESEARPNRRETEERWIKDLYQYRGEYTPDEATRLPEGGSRVYPPATRKKVTTISARLRDMLFPASASRNWTLEATPKPDLTPQDEQAAQAMAQQEDIDHEAARERIAEQRAERMRKQMDDQLAEADYAEIVGGDVIRSGCIYGTGILKGPMVEEQEQTRFRAQGGTFALSAETVRRPYIEGVSIWNLYPDMGGRGFGDVRYVFQLHQMPRHELLDLAERDDFYGETILDYVRSSPDGDLTDQTHDAELRQLGGRQSAGTPQGRYEVLEYWGVVDPADLADYDDDAADAAEELWANVWLLGHYVIKAVVSPAPGPRKHPYHAFHFDKDETSIFGIGVPALMRDDQAMTCAATRAMLDNAAIASGPILEVNTSLLAPGEDAASLYPRRMFYREGVGQEAQYPAIRELGISSHIGEYLNLIQLADQWTHEHTVPSYMEGQPTSSGGAQGTASGLSMLMGAANVEIKDLARSFDEGITRSFITALYRWNMYFGEDEAKGDYNVEARGSSSLVHKEIRAQRLDQFAGQATQLPDAQRVDWEELLRRRLEAHDLPDSLMVSEEEYQQQMQQAQQPGPEQQMEMERIKLEPQKMQLEQQRLQIEQQKAQADMQKTMAETQTERAEAAETAADARQTEVETALQMAQGPRQ